MWFPDFKELSSEDQKADSRGPVPRQAAAGANYTKEPSSALPVPLPLFCLLAPGGGLPCCLQQSAQLGLWLCFPSSPPPPSSLLALLAERFVPTAHLIVDPLLAGPQDSFL